MSWIIRNLTLTPSTVSQTLPPADGSLLSECQRPGVRHLHRLTEVDIVLRPRSGIGDTWIYKENEPNNGDERAKTGLIAHQRPCTLACSVAELLSGGRSSLGRSDSCRLLDFSFSHRSSLISNSCSLARQLATDSEWQPCH